MEMHPETFYRIGLTLIPGIGAKLAKGLIAHCGSAKQVFLENKKSLQKIPGIGTVASKNIANQSVLVRAEEELKFMEKQAVRPLFFLEPDYPQRLKLCEDGPLMLYFKGNTDLNKRQVIAMVGTRNATQYGLQFCENFCKEIKNFNPMVISGLAYGIDVAAHKQALQAGLPTVGVLAHGLDRLYPSVHQKVADQMLENGGLLTEFLSGTNPDRENFPKRNRIVAGISDAVVVVEAAKKGGALITAEIANSYNRDVFAVPGNLGARFSEGCNWLIKSNRAALLSGAQDLKYILGWEEQERMAVQQTQMFVQLEGIEQKIWEHLQTAGGKSELDILCLKLELSSSKVLSALMTLELKGLVNALPGKVYSI